MTAAETLMKALDLTANLADLLIKQGYAEIADIAAESLQNLLVAGKLDPDTAIELKHRAVQYLAETQSAPAEATANLTSSAVARSEGTDPAQVEAPSAAAGMRSTNSGAARMRRSRERRREGLRCLTIEVRTTEIDALVCRGLLDAGKRDDGGAILAALHTHLDATLVAPAA